MHQIKNIVTLYLLQETEKKKTEEIQDDYLSGYTQGKISAFQFVLEVINNSDEKRPSKIAFKGTF